MLVLFTVAVCAVSYLMNINAFLLYFSYLVGIAILKGISSNDLKDVFNIRKAKYIYNEVGFLNSLNSFSSLLLITVYYAFNEYEYFSIEYMIPIIVCYILIYRFLFWDIAYRANHLLFKNRQ